MPAPRTPPKARREQEQEAAAFIRASQVASRRMQKTKGPASAATDPDRGSTNPAKDMAMNSKKDTTAPGGAASAPFSIPPAIMNLDLAPLRQMNAKELRNLRSALRTLVDVAYGMHSQPRIEGKSNASEFMSELCELICGAHDAVFEAAKALKVETAADIEHRAWCILGVRAEWADDLMDVSADAAEFLRQHSAAQFREARS